MAEETVISETEVPELLNELSANANALLGN